MTPRTQPNAVQALLLSILGAAFVLLVGGVWLAQRTEGVSIEGDRVALGCFARATEELIEERQTIWHARLSEKAKEYRDAWESGLPLTEAFPKSGDEASGQPLLFVDEVTVSDDIQGLSPQADRELILVAYRSPERANTATGLQILNIGVHLPAIRSVISRELSVLLGERAALFLPRGETVRVVAPDGAFVWKPGTPSEPESNPSVVIPIPLRWGTWSVAVWDRTEPRVAYDRRLLVGAGTLSGLVFLVGLAHFLLYQQAFRRAAERVSFLNRLSHELRAPLTNVLLHLDLAEDELEEATAPAQRHLALIRDEAGRLGRLVDNALRLLAAEEGALRLHRQPSTPSAVVDAVIEQFRPALQRSGIAVRRSGGTDGTAELDPEALAQIVANLLSNVEKYAPGAPVVIAEHWTESHFELSVADHGPGIPVAESECIFRDWYRVSNHIAEGSTGIGLGLGIARDLARRLGGDLWLVPSEHGAAFLLQLPRAPTEQEPAPC